MPDTESEAESGSEPDERTPLPGISQEPGSSLSGLGAAALSFFIWGLLPIFWKALGHVDSFEILCHRIVWSFLFLVPLMCMHGRLGALLTTLRQPKVLFGLLLSGYILAGNWYLYIWAINADKVLEASLGYYITPLVNILLGVVFFREKISKTVCAAIGIAVLGVGWQVASLGHLPLTPLGLAFSFAIYGLIRKVLVIQAIPGLFVETLAVAPLAFFWICAQAWQGNSAFFLGSLSTDALLISTGIITTIPLVCFGYGTRRIRMTTLGLLQYFTPSCVFLLGVFVYDEPFTFDSLVTFACIWTALALYTRETVRTRRW